MRASKKKRKKEKRTGKRIGRGLTIRGSLAHAIKMDEGSEGGAKSGTGEA